MPRAALCPSGKPVSITLGGNLPALVWDGRAEVTVPSKSHPGQSWTVTVTRDGTTCGCPAFTYRGHCSHMDRVAAAITLRSAA